MLPPAPGLFSTTTLWPHASPSFWAISRPTTSSGPPGGKGTTSLTACDGKTSAAALGMGSADSAAAAAASATVDDKSLAKRFSSDGDGGSRILATGPPVCGGARRAAYNRPFAMTSTTQQ